jgi:two-component system, cell cycle sensor histidine kinase and response regulator CckA
VTGSPQKELAIRLQYEIVLFGANMPSNTELAESIPGDEIHLPVIEVPAFPEGIAGIVSAEVYEWGGKETILLVEDESFVRKSASEALELAGYTVLAAESASQALEILHKNLGATDLLISDIVLPDKNGHELAREFAVLVPGIPILLVSGYGDKLISQQLALHNEHFLSKPFSFSMLLRKVRQILDRSIRKMEIPA